MKSRRRLYRSILEEHLLNRRQMAFVSGPRQVGKTTTCHGLADVSLSWDAASDREILLAGGDTLAEVLGLDRLQAKSPVALFDELHKFPRWKQFLKGLFDVHSEHLRILVTGSSRLDVYRRGGDSLMGRYFLYRMHPFSIAETITTALPDPERIVRPPKRPKPAELEALWEHGGFPEPFLLRDKRFSRRWRSLRFEQLVREEIRDQTQIQHLDQLQVLVRILSDRSSQQLIFNNLANQARVSVDTVRRWITALCDLHLGFLVRPWFQNVARSLRKEPKWYLRDWSSIEDLGARAETFIACHLLKAVEGWTDLGLGTFELGYLRDKSQREVDFVVIRDGQPWFLVEVKTGEGSLSSALAHFQDQLGAPYAFQVTASAKYIDADCFEAPRGPLIVPASTLLSQLL
ncbi:MAG: AAA family ATPase [Planctomycetota bacterium]